MKSYVLVTGATGFTGGHLATALARTGYKVRALVRDAAAGKGLADLGIEIVQGDLTRKADVDKAVKGVEQIYHVAAHYRTAKLPDQVYWDVNVGGTQHILEAAQREGVERVIHCSTIGVHGGVREVPADENAPYDPGDIYQRTKLEGEKCAQRAFTAGLRGVIVRPAGIYGPGDRRFLKLFKMIKQRRFLMFGSGQACCHLVYIDDLVDGMLLSGTRREAVGEIFILAGDQYVSLNSLVKQVAVAVGVQSSTRRLPLWPLMTAATICEYVCRPFGIEPILHRRRAEFFVKNRAFTSQKAQSQIGYEPKVSLTEGLAKTAAWYEQAGLL